MLKIPKVKHNFTLVRRKSDRALTTFSKNQMKTFNKDRFEVVTEEQIKAEYEAENGVVIPVVDKPVKKRATRKAATKKTAVTPVVSEEVSSDNPAIEKTDKPS